MHSLLNLGDDIKYDYGWVYVIIIGFNLLVNLSLILFGFFTVSIPDLYQKFLKFRDYVMFSYNKNGFVMKKKEMALRYPEDPHI
jgi:hypothetical protein